MLTIKNCRILKNNDMKDTNIFIQNGKIAEIGHYIRTEQEMDAKGALLLPGLIDCHVHCREPGMEHKEDFSTATQAAAAGGVTTILDMPNTKPPTLTLTDLKEKRELAKRKCMVNYGFYFGSSKLNMLEIQKAENIAAVKIYMDQTTGGLIINDRDVLEDIFSKALYIAVHAEEDSMELALELARKYNNFLYICHVASKREVEMIQSKKNKRIFAEVTPHHLFLTEKNVADLRSFAMMKPSLKSVEDQYALWEALRKGIIDTVGTDHAPHTVEEKVSYNPPFGLPGLETMLPLLMTAFSRGKLSLTRIQQACCEKPAEIFGIAGKGRIEKGMDADLVLVDLKMEKPVRNDALFTRCKWSPFNGWKLQGWPMMTMVGGKVVFDHGEILQNRGQEVVFQR
ncbi:amidohydrolase family protein [Candidatus Woesearchaeota archaeon]|nr:amidohydrolase family protein [Candidatus Woesearchaeota archaeon]